MIMSHDEFTKLYQHMEAFRKSVDERFEEARRDRSEIKATIVELGSQIKANRMEILALGAKVDRLHAHDNGHQQL